VPQQTPALYYSFSEKFNYREYLEQRSHFDRVEVTVDSGLRELLASNEALANRNIKASHAAADRIAQRVDELSDTVAAGFDRMEFALGDVKSSVDGLQSICEHGFSELSLRLTSIGETLNELLKVARTPTQTWAWEQFSVAQDAFRRRLYTESLAYVNKAINGDGASAGYPLEHRFYILRGTIELGDYSNFSEEIVDVGKAKNSFLLAAKYAEHVDQRDFSRCLGFAGWAAYCAGDMQEAEDLLRRSIATNREDMQSTFELAKVCLKVGKVADGIKHFERAMRSDFGYGLRAAADPDFLAHKDAVNASIEAYRNELTQKLSSFSTRSKTLVSPERKAIIDRHDLKLDSQALSHLEELPKRIEKLPVSDLLGELRVTPERYQALQTSLQRAKEALLSRSKQKASEVVTTKSSVKKFLDGFSSVVVNCAFAGGGIMAIIMIFGIFEKFSSPSFLDIIILPFYVVIVGGFGVLLGLIGGGIVGLLVAPVYRLFSHSQERAVADRKASQAELASRDLEADAAKL
jgi:tetratricopeptide (TPR) repeat protein